MRVVIDTDVLRADSPASLLTECRVYIPAKGTHSFLRRRFPNQYVIDQVVAGYSG